MVSAFMRAYIKTKNRNILSHYHNIRKKYIQSGGNDSIIDDFVFNEYIERSDNNIENTGVPVSIQIFIGGQSDCLVGIIHLDESADTIYIQYFAYNKHCSIYKNLEKSTGTKRMMHAFFKYIVKKHPEIKIIKLADDATIQCDNNAIDLYKLYMLKYGIGYYEKQFNFKIDQDDNLPDVLAIHTFNIQNAPHITINKNDIQTKLQNMLDDKIQFLQEFLDKIIDNEPVSTFLTRTKHMPDEMCDIYDFFITIIYNSHLRILKQPLIYFINIDEIQNLELLNTQ